MKFFEGLIPQNKLFSVKKITSSNENFTLLKKMDIHIQTSVEMIFVLGGKVDVSVNGLTESVRLGDGALIFPFQPNGYTATDDAEFIIVDFDASLARDFFNPNYDTVGERAVFKPSSVTDFIIKNALLSDTDSSRFAVQSLIYSAISDFTEQNELIKRKNDDNILMNTIAYLRKNKDRPLKMASVAKELGYSQSYFSFAMNKNAGLSFNTLLAMIRIESAKLLLSETDKTVLEIMLECGFGSERSFYRQFSDIVGTSPLKYRASIFNDSTDND